MDLRDLLQLHLKGSIVVASGVHHCIGEHYHCMVDRNDAAVLLVMTVLPVAGQKVFSADASGQQPYCRR